VVRPIKNNTQQAGSVEQIRKTFLECKTYAEPIAQRYRNQALINESFYAGASSQWSSLASNVHNKTVITEGAWWDHEKVPRLAINLYTGLFMTWHSLITADRPDVKAVPATPEPVDSYRAAFADKVITYIEGEVDSAEAFNDMVRIAGLSGTGGLKITYRADDDRIVWAPIGVGDYLIDPDCGGDYRDARWIIFSDHIGKEEAIELLRAAGIDKKPQVIGYKNAAGEHLKGVERFEYWARPTSDYPNGLYACFVGNDLVESMDYPYLVHDDSDKIQYLLPLVLMTVRKQRSSPYGHTNFSDIVEPQRQLNEINSRFQQQLRTLKSHLKLPRSLDGFNPAEASVLMIPDDKLDIARNIDWTQPPRIAPELQGRGDYISSMMQNIVGINSTTNGTQQSSQSGRAIENLRTLDHDRNADCTRSMQQAIKDSFRLTLALISRYYTEPRQRRITDGDHDDVLEFSSADVDGVSIRLIPASETDRFPQVAGAEAQEQGGSAIDVEKATNAPQLGMSRTLAENLIKEFLATGRIDVMPDDLDPAVLDDVVEQHKARAVQARNMPLYLRLVEFKKAVADLAQRANEAAPQPQQQAQPDDQQQANPQPPQQPQAGATQS
jgi:hypothetical protein